MKYEETVIIMLLIMFILLLTICIIQSYEIKNKDETLTKINNQLVEYKNKKCICEIQSFSDELTFSEDGLRIEHNLKPKIEVIK